MTFEDEPLRAAVLASPSSQTVSDEPASQVPQRATEAQERAHAEQVLRDIAESYVRDFELRRRMIDDVVEFLDVAGWPRVDKNLEQG